MAEILEEMPESLKDLLSGLSVPKTCLICGQYPYLMGIFNPFDSQLYGAKKGKTRIVFYALCKECSEKENVSDKVEKIMLHDLNKSSG